MDWSNLIVSVIALAISVASIAFSIFTYVQSYKRQRIIDTIDAYRTLQSDVLDKFVSYTSNDVQTLLDCLDDEKVRIAYDDCRAMIAKIEHFAVGVSNRIYDFDTVDKLGGVHLIFLFKKVKPIIDNTRENQGPSERKYYEEFEIMVNRLGKMNAHYHK